LETATRDCAPLPSSGRSTTIVDAAGAAGAAVRLGPHAAADSATTIAIAAIVTGATGTGPGSATGRGPPAFTAPRR
jgi:hypothetical protein